MAKWSINITLSKEASAVKPHPILPKKQKRNYLVDFWYGRYPCDLALSLMLSGIFLFVLLLRKFEFIAHWTSYEESFAITIWIIGLAFLGFSAVSSWRSHHNSVIKKTGVILFTLIGIAGLSGAHSEASKWAKMSPSDKIIARFNNENASE